MNSKPNKLISPLPSTASTPCSTQAPTSIKDRLSSRGIPIKIAEEWNREYNYESIPCMPEDEFWGLLIELADDVDSEDIESKVSSVMKQRNTRSREKFEEQAYKIMLSGAKIFHDQSQKSAFISALDEQHTIHGYEGLIAECLPALFNALRQQKKPKSRQRNSTGHTRKKVVSRGALKSSPEPIRKIGTRRSPRNRKPYTPPSN